MPEAVIKRAAAGASSAMRGWKQFCAEVMVTTEARVMEMIEKSRTALDADRGEMARRDWHKRFTEDARSCLVYTIVDTIFSFVQHRDQLAEVLGDQRFQDLVRFVTEEERQCFTTAQSETNYFHSLVNRMLRLSDLVDFQQQPAGSPEDALAVIPHDPVEDLLALFAAPAPTAASDTDTDHPPLPPPPSRPPPQLENNLALLSERVARAKSDNETSDLPALSAVEAWRQSLPTLDDLQKRLEKFAAAAQAITTRGAGSRGCGGQVVTLFGRTVFVVVPGGAGAGAEIEAGPGAGAGAGAEAGVQNVVEEFLRLQREKVQQSGGDEDAGTWQACRQCPDFLPMLKEETCLPKLLLTHVDKTVAKLQGGGGGGGDVAAAAAAAAAAEDAEKRAGGQEGMEGGEAMTTEAAANAGPEGKAAVKAESEATADKAAADKAAPEATADKAAPEATADKAAADKAAPEATADKAAPEATAGKSAADKAAPEATADKAAPEATADKAVPEAIADKSAADKTAPKATSDKAASEDTADKAAPEATADKSAADKAAPEATVDKAAPEATVDKAAPEATVDKAAPEATVDKKSEEDTADKKPEDTATKKPGVDTADKKPADTADKKPADTADKKPADTADGKSEAITGKSEVTAVEKSEEAPAVEKSEEVPAVKSEEATTVKSEAAADKNSETTTDKSEEPAIEKSEATVDKKLEATVKKSEEATTDKKSGATETMAKKNEEATADKEGKKGNLETIAETALDGAQTAGSGCRYGYVFCVQANGKVTEYFCPLVGYLPLLPVLVEKGAAMDAA